MRWQFVLVVVIPLQYDGLNFSWSSTCVGFGHRVKDLLGINLQFSKSVVLQFVGLGRPKSRRFFLHVPYDVESVVDEDELSLLNILPFGEVDVILRLRLRLR